MRYVWRYARISLSLSLYEYVCVRIWMLFRLHSRTYSWIWTDWENEKMLRWASFRAVVCRRKKPKKKNNKHHTSFIPVALAVAFNSRVLVQAYESFYRLYMFTMQYTHSHNRSVCVLYRHRFYISPLISNKMNVHKQDISRNVENE